MKRLMTVLILTLLANFAQAEGFASKQETRIYADQIMDRFVKKEFQAALNGAKPYWPIPAVEIDGLANVIAQQWPVIDQRFGATTAKEFLKEENIGKSFVRYYYLQKFERHALYWKIDFYKPRDTWVINSIVYLDDLEPLFK